MSARSTGQPSTCLAPPISEGEGGGLSRRSLLKTGLAGCLLLAGGVSWIPLSRALEKAGGEYALIIDLNACVGCGACEVACTLRNGLPEGQSLVRRIPRGEGRDRWYLTVQCQQCQDAPCMTVCPTRATYRHASGVVLVNEKACVGCKYCAVACPYDARIFDERTGVAAKCSLCLPWVLEGGQPACVQACIEGARIFGRRDEPHIAELLASGRAQPLHPEFGTNPGLVHYIFPGT
jgi:Fe-S-cluster-containing dehydrogenase component